MREVYEVDILGGDPFEVPALVLSAMARPGAGEAGARRALYLSLCAYFIRDRAMRNPAWGAAPQRLIPNIGCRDEAVIKRDLKTFERRMKDRITAGHIGAAFAKSSEMGHVPPLPEGARRLSANEMLTSIAADRGIVDIANLRSRVWSPSQPVLHLCVAWVTIAQEHIAKHGTAPVPHEALLDPQILTLLLYRAERIEPLLEQSRVQLSADRLIRFRLKQPGS